KTRRRPKRSASEPDSMSRHAITRVYASIVHCRPLTEACSERWIDGKATLTIVVSRPAMNTLRQQTASTTERRRAPSARDSELTVVINIVVAQQWLSVQLILSHRRSNDMFRQIRRSASRGEAQTTLPHERATRDRSAVLEHATFASTAPTPKPSPSRISIADRSAMGQCHALIST